MFTQDQPVRADGCPMARGSREAGARAAGLDVRGISVAFMACGVARIVED
jgi:hypothetical protein